MLKWYIRFGLHLKLLIFIEQDKGQAQLLSVNFGKQLAEAFEEGRLWTRLGYGVSKTIAQLQADSERLRLLRWRVDSLTSSCNQAGLLANLSNQKNARITSGISLGGACTIIGHECIQPELWRSLVYTAWWLAPEVARADPGKLSMNKPVYKP